MKIIVLYFSEVEFSPKQKMEVHAEHTTNWSLGKHKESMHKRDIGKEIKCEYCDHIASRNNLQIHVRSVHLGFKFPCNVCDYEATKKAI